MHLRVQQKKIRFRNCHNYELLHVCWLCMSNAVIFNSSVITVKLQRANKNTHNFILNKSDSMNGIDGNRAHIDWRAQNAFAFHLKQSRWKSIRADNLFGNKAPNYCFSQHLCYSYFWCEFNVVLNVKHCDSYGPNSHLLALHWSVRSILFNV